MTREYSFQNIALQIEIDNSMVSLSRLDIGTSRLSLRPGSTEIDTRKHVGISLEVLFDKIYYEECIAYAVKRDDQNIEVRTITMCLE